MSEEKIRVHVVAYGDCKNLILRYRDPSTGRQVRRSSGTTNRREARRLAAEWEAKLSLGLDEQASKLSWADFRLRYETEVLSGLADGTRGKVSTVFNTIERILPAVANGKLKDLSAAGISKLQAELRQTGRTESTIAGHRAHLRAALAWAVDQELLPRLPKIRPPKRAKTASKSSPMKGRPVTTEEFERMLAVAEKVVGDETGPAWRHYLEGLWWSGLRLAESLELYWDRPDRLCVDLAGRHPMLRIPAELEKGHQDRLLTMAPEFAEFLLSVPEEDRRGRVFRLWARRGGWLTKDRVSRIGVKIGRAANIKVYTHPQTGRVKYASLHDLRRAFGERWSHRIMPPDLMILMRHESIETTLKYYVGRNSQATADLVWEAYRQHAGGTVLGTVGPGAMNIGPELMPQTLVDK
jgi:site-specific recombinase XerC